jgi:citrate lyase beta subunit
VRGAPARRPRRALLFCPGSEREKIEKAARVGADGVILDLEDSVARSKKAEARAIVADALACVDFGASERLVRTNPIGSGLEADDLLVARAPRPPDAIVLPKVESAADVRHASAALERIESGRGLAPGSIRLLAIIETARGVTRLGEIAASDPRLEALIFGAEDLCGDLGAVRTREGREVLVARSLVVLHAAAERLQAIDTPFVNLADEAGLVADVRAAVEMG